MGKTSLVQKVMSLVDSDKVKVVYLDIFKCRTEEAFLNAFASAVIKATSNQREARIINISKFLSRIPPKIEIGSDPINHFELSFDIAQSTVGILYLSKYLSMVNKHIWRDKWGILKTYVTA